MVNTEQDTRRISVRGAAMVRVDAARGWTVTEPARPGTDYLLNGVAAASPPDVWAVGQTRLGPLVQRWDGAGWTLVSCPPPPGGVIAAGLRGVAAVRGRAIAVGGGYDRPVSMEVPLIRHWDGRVWTEMEAPDIGGAYVLTAVTMPSAGEAWAVGHGFAGRRGSRPGAVVLRWDGIGWARIPVPGTATGALLAVAASGPGDVWAAGSGANRRPLLLHFDGTAWRDVPVPRTRARRGLTGVAVRSQRDAWAVGTDALLRWDGAAWSAEPGPSVRGGLGPLGPPGPLGPLPGNTVAVAADVWVADAGGVVRFDGTRWERIPARADTVWLGSAAAGNGAIWLVGSRRDSSV